MDSFASIKNLKDLEVYQLARELGKLVWNIVIQWDYSKRKTIGDQWTQSTDSISANIAEGYGRYYFKETIRFYYYSRGSEFESYDWFEKAKERGLLKEGEIDQFQILMDQIPKELNILIKRTRINAENYGREQ
ncbi:four helix bundle protein [Candidatus Peregrinibacteria bacterium CG_4_10_14_0_2_um_filter_43_11]|nr:MAG: four helix bundle protein [Candidatus Peregrinibacteria bacterium CG_4_10_14_0_2_um_filter_43_11]